MRKTNEALQAQLNAIEAEDGQRPRKRRKTRQSQRLIEKKETTKKDDQSSDNKLTLPGDKASISASSAGDEATDKTSQH